MKILDTLFREALSASINDDGQIEFPSSGFQMTPVEALLSDDKAYKSEFAAWLNDVWLDRHRQRLKGLLALHGNERRYKDLCGAISRGNAVPAVGSGMSAPSGLLLWRQFLEQLRSYTSVEPIALAALLDDGKYEEAADILAADMGKPLFDERVEHEFRVEHPSALCGAVRLLPELFPHLVITTNLDDVLENVYASSDKRLDEVLAGRDVERYRQLHGKGRTVLLKLHGDCRKDDGRVLGVKEYDEAYAAGSAARDALALIYRTRPVLWVGCSLSVDRTVQLVGEIVGSDSGTPRHFAFLQLPADDATRVSRERELAKRHIFPVWYDGDHDDAIETLLVGVLDHLGRFGSGINR